MFSVPDRCSARCMDPECSVEFTFLQRRHHCRRCGMIFCGTCSQFSAKLPKQGYKSPVRVCRTCFEFERRRRVFEGQLPFLEKGGTLQKFMQGIAKHVTHSVKDSIRSGLTSFFGGTHDGETNAEVGDESNATVQVHHDVHVWIEASQRPGLSQNVKFCWRNVIVDTDSSTFSPSIKTRRSTVRHKARLLKDVRAISKGIKTETLKNQFKTSSDTEAEGRMCFSLIFADRSLDFRALDESSRKKWLEALEAATQFATFEPSPASFRERVLKDVFLAEKKYHSEEERQRRERELQFRKTEQSARARLEARQKARERRLNEIEKWKKRK